MTIKQISGTYFTQEDRILFRFNTQNQEEYRFWLTRRVALFILAATSHLITKKLEVEYSPDAAKAINEFGKQAFLDAATDKELQTQAYEAGLHYPLGFDPLLVVNVTCSLTKNGEKLAQLENIKHSEIDDELSIDFMLPGGVNLNLKLAQNTMQAMCTLIDQIRQEAGWGEGVLQTNNLTNEDQNLDAKMSKNVLIN